MSILPDYLYGAIRCLLAEVRKVFSHGVRRLYLHMARLLRVERFEGYHRQPVEMEEGKFLH